MDQQTTDTGSPNDRPPPPAAAPLPVIPIDEEFVEVEAEDAAGVTPPEDDPLVAVARAESELEAIDAGEFPDSEAAAPGELRYPGPTRASKRAALNRGNPAWGILSFSLAIFVWSFLLLGWLVVGTGRLGGRIAELAVLNAVFSSLAAIVFGTIGRRKKAARKRALAGRFMAWMTPGIVILFFSVISYFRALFGRGYWHVEISPLYLLAGLVLEAAVGLFIFVLIDGVTE